jgi:uncharacterized protein
MKFVILLVAAVVLVGMLAATWRRLTGKDDAAKPAPKNQSRKNARGQPLAAPTMRACAHCGVHMPETEMLRGDGQFFCSPAHLQAGPRDRTAARGSRDSQL